MHTTAPRQLARCIEISAYDKLSATIELETQRSPLRVERYLNGSSSALGLHFDL